MGNLRLHEKTSPHAARVHWKKAAKLKRAHAKAVSKALAATQATMQQQARLELEQRAQLPFDGTDPGQPPVPDWIHDYVQASHDLRLLGGAVYCAHCGGISKQPTGQSKLSKGKICKGIPPNLKPESLRAAKRKLSQLNAGLWHPALVGPWPDLQGGTGPRTPHKLHCTNKHWSLFHE